MSDQERKLFEEALEGEAHFWWISEVGQYNSTITQQMWKAWQRARQTPASGEVEPLPYDGGDIVATAEDRREKERMRYMPERLLELAYEEVSDAAAEAQEGGEYCLPEWVKIVTSSDCRAHPPAKVPGGYVLAELHFTPDYVLEAGKDCLRALESARVNDTRTVAAAVFKDMLLALHKNAPNHPSGECFQERVAPWMQACFGPEISADKMERNHRFLEESLELVQSLGCTKHEAIQLVDYVYGREVGDPPQEVGGVMVTLAALCLASDMDMHQCGETELARVWTKVEKIRAKQAAKPKHSPLPEHPSGEWVAQVIAERERQDRKWGGPEHDDQKSPNDFVQHIEDYAGWARVMAGMGSFEKYRRRMIQVAALAGAAIEAADRAMKRNSLSAGKGAD